MPFGFVERRFPQAYKFVTFTAAMLAMFAMGTLYAFSAYAPGLRKQLNFTQTDINVVSSVGDLGLYFGGLPMGAFYDFFGAQVTYSLSGILGFLGYMLMWLGSLEIVGHAPLLMALYLSFAGFGSFAGYTAGLVTNVRNFSPQHRGKITGVLVSAYGLSAAVVSQVNKLWFAGQNVGSFLYFLTIFTGAMPILGFLFVRLSTESPQKSNPTRTLLEDKKPLIGTEGGGTADGGATTYNTVAASPQRKNQPKYGEITGISLVRSPDFILLFFAQMFGCGVGLLFINIVGDVIKSFQVVDLTGDTYVITLSLSNAAGRLIMGLMTDLKPAWMPAAALLLPCLALVTIGQTMLIFTTNYIVLFISTILTGLSYGGQFAIIPVVLNRYFGDRHYGANVGLQALSVASGSLLMGFISGKMADAHSTVNPSGETECFGSACYMGTFIMTSCVAFAAHAFVVFLVRREKKFDARLKTVDEEDAT